MFSPRNTRVLLSAIVIIGVTLFLLSSPSSINRSVQKSKPANSVDDTLLHTDPLNDNQNENYKPKLSATPPYSSKPQPDAVVEVIGDENTVPKSTKGAELKDAKEPIMADKGQAASNADKKPRPSSYPYDKAPADKSSIETPHKGSDKVTEKIEIGTICNDKDFVIVIDAGSTGSRVHVYEFDTCQSPPVLLNETFEMLKPGLSSFDEDAKGAAASLDPLLKLALETIPKNKQSCTPVAVKATAGLRLLGEEKSSKILASVRQHLENDFPFAVVPGDGISIMDGKDEGVYAWITTNYLLGNIGSSEKTPTAAVFDLGGGSTQIVFEPEFGQNERMVDGEHKYELSFGNRDFTLYQFSHLGYGLMEGRNKINSLIVNAQLETNAQFSQQKLTKEQAKSAKGSSTLSNPCIPPGLVANDVKVSLENGDIYVVNMKGPETSGGAQCRFLAEKILAKDAECTSKPCSFNGVHQPSLTKAFKSTSDMFIFSYFYDRTNPLGFPSSFSLEELKDLTKLICNGDELWSSVLQESHIKELKEEPQWCLDLSFIVAMLHTGYDIPLHRELKTAKKIDNNELGWCLGASLPLLDQKASGWECKVTQA